MACTPEQLLNQLRNRGASPIINHGVCTIRPPARFWPCLTSPRLHASRSETVASRNHLLIDARQLASVMAKRMREQTHEQRLQAAARLLGLKLVLDRYRAASTGRDRYFLRPIWDARRAVQVRPAGGYKLVRITEKGRRTAASLLPLDEIESILANWDEPRTNPPAQLPWRTRAGS